jgi:hypothetical protein
MTVSRVRCATVPQETREERLRHRSQFLKVNGSGVVALGCSE